MRDDGADPAGPAEIPVDAALLARARDAGVDPARAAADGIERAIVRARAGGWLAENADALDDWNRYVARNGLPLARHRRF